MKSVLNKPLDIPKQKQQTSSPNNRRQEARRTPTGRREAQLSTRLYTDSAKPSKTCGGFKRFGLPHRTGKTFFFMDC